MEERPRQRVWKPKVKTGCATCKLRRIKCDEAKPFCRRCTSSGRRCEGYDTALTASLSVPRRSSALHHLPASMLGITNREKESLNFFYGQTVPEFAGIFESSFWQRDLPLAASHHTALRTAVIGLGAMHRKFVDVKRHTLPSNISDQQVTFALKYCNRAIREIIDGNSIDIVMTLTFCVLFHCFAWLQGHLPIALSHLRGGLKILQEIDSGKIQIKQSKLHPISFKSLRGIFVNLDMQVRSMMNQDQLPFWEPKPKSIPREEPSHFTTFDEARSYIEESFNEICSFLLLMDMGPKMELEISQEEIRRLTKQYGKGDQLLTDFLSQSSTKLDKQQQKSLLVLNMCRHQVDIFVQAYCGGPKKSELVWDEMEYHFDQIVTNAREILEGNEDLSEEDEELTSPETGIPKPQSVASGRGQPSSTSSVSKQRERPIMTFSMGIVSSLWTVAFRCRNPAIRRSAIRLLVDHPRREGFWDGTMTAKLASQVLAMEEEACKNDPNIADNDPEWTVTEAVDIPDHHRVASVSINYTGLRSANIKYTTMTDLRKGRAGVVHPLIW